MAIKTSCPHCEKEYNLADTLSGKMIRCKSCNETFRVGGSAPNGERRSSVATAPPRKRRPERSPDEVEEVVAADDDYDDYDDPDRPARRRGARSKAKGGIPLWVWLAGGGGVALLLIVGVVVLIFVMGGSKVTRENFSKLKHGMTEAEVTAILGSPTDSQDTGQMFGMVDKGIKPGGLSVKYSIWKSGKNVIVVVYTNGKVTELQFADTGNLNFGPFK
jgi:hypothetical protein